jgi:transcriptional regulator with XRE-family HTH domain
LTAGTTGIAGKETGTPGIPGILGKNIKKLRKERGLTLTELATRAEVGIGTLCDIEKGRSRIARESTQGAIAKALGVEIAELWRA